MTSDRWYARNIVYFAALHALPLGALVTGAGAGAFVAAGLLYLVRVWFVGAGYHCYFSHRAFKTSRAFQLVLAVGAQTSAQGSVLRWAAGHRVHHAHADEPGDLHSPAHGGLWHAHLGWLLRTGYLARTQPRPIDLLRYPELAWLDRYHYVPPLALAAALLVVLGGPGLFIGYGLSTVAVYHATFSVNSLAHRFGSQPYPSDDRSRNNGFVALLMLGGGWHNNHHRYPRSARQGLRWWELDPTYLGLVVLGWVGVVWAIRTASEPRTLSAPGAPRTPARSRRPYSG